MSKRGEWANTVAADYLRRCGSLIVDLNAGRGRNRIDVVAYDVREDSIAICEVRTPSEANWFHGLSASGRQHLRRASRAWTRANGWRGAVRHDVINVYGRPGERPVIDHIRNVKV